jgi:hypothetical protein
MPVELSTRDVDRYIADYYNPTAIAQQACGYVNRVV